MRYFKNSEKDVPLVFISSQVLTNDATNSWKILSLRLLQPIAIKLPPVHFNLSFMKRKATKLLDHELEKIRLFFKLFIVCNEKIKR